MQINSDDFEFLVGNMDTILEAEKVASLPMFADKSIEFLNALSREILKDKRTKHNVDVVSYAYWIRKSSIESAKKKHLDRKNRIGRGIAFHIAPSNVPVNFAVSMTSSLLAGNISIIRVSNNKYEQVDIICDAINKLLNSEYIDMKSYFCILRYQHNERITQELSSICDVRIIWGGDRTIETIRKASIPTRAIELAFADRYSLVIINSDEYIQMDAKKIAKDFYIDTYYSDQNACSSPRLVVWTGNNVKKAQKIFWEYLDKMVKEKYNMKPIQAIDKYTSFTSLAMEKSKIQLESKDNYVVRVAINNLSSDIMNYKNGGGYFFEYIAKNMQELVPILGKKCQTVSYLGIDKNEIKNIVFNYGVKGVDRIVPLGQTMGLEFIWDGFKMIDMMSRFVYTGEYI